MCMTAEEETCVSVWEKEMYLKIHEYVCGHERTFYVSKFCMCEEMRQKSEINPKHHSSYFSAGVLCKSNWVENSAPASYFCSKNALSKVMRTVFEVAPAGKYSRRLYVCVCALPLQKASVLL